jgi:hypothetical protein
LSSCGLTDCYCHRPERDPMNQDAAEAMYLTGFGCGLGFCVLFPLTASELVCVLARFSMLPNLSEAIQGL